MKISYYAIETLQTHYVVRFPTRSARDHWLRKFPEHRKAISAGEAQKLLRGMMYNPSRWLGLGPNNAMQKILT